jgi:ceramide glucosyltransferase
MHAGPLLGAAGTALAAAATAYLLTAWVILRARHRALAGARAPRLPAAGVTVLKPLCGAEPTLYGCLRSFCEQDLVPLQIVCGVRDAADPAVEVVRRLQREFPQLALDLVIEARQHGSSLKVSNLINMLALARHDVLVISDADVHAPTGYLLSVVGALERPGTGLVTCGYRGEPAPGPWSALLATFINDWFMPSVYVAAALGSQVFVSGVTIALTRRTLGAIGGFAAIADQLADDYRLGELTRRLGLKTVLADVEVATCVEERSLRALLRHELRWLRTIRVVQPRAYASLFLTFGWPVAALGCALAPGSAPALALLGLGVLARLLLHFEARRGGSTPLMPWVIFINDLLGLALWCWSFTSRRVHWRQARYRVSRDGSVQPIT